MMPMDAGAIFLDGKMVRASTALADSLAPGVVEGKGAFETMRVCDGGIGDLHKHLGRLSRGLNTLHIRAPYSQKQLKQYLSRTLKAGGLQQARIRLAVWKERRVLRIALVCQPFAGYSDAKYKKGFKAAISDIKRKKTKISHIKSMDYACFRRAFMEARAKGCDEAILLNSRMEIVEGSRTNIFFVKKNVLYTPAVKCGALNGITRQQVIRCARKEKDPCRAVAVNVRALFQADEAFVTSSLIGVMPLTVVAGRPVGSGRVGPVTRKLLRAYHTNTHSSCPAEGKSV